MFHRVLSAFLCKQLPQPGLLNTCIASTLHRHHAYCACDLLAISVFEESSKFVKPKINSAGVHTLTFRKSKVGRIAIFDVKTGTLTLKDANTHDILYMYHSRIQPRQCIRKK